MRACLFTLILKSLRAVLDAPPGDPCAGRPGSGVASTRGREGPSVRGRFLSMENGHVGHSGGQS